MGVPRRICLRKATSTVRADGRRPPGAGPPGEVQVVDVVDVVVGVDVPATHGVGEGLPGVRRAFAVAGDVVTAGKDPGLVQLIGGADLRGNAGDAAGAALTRNQREVPPGHQVSPERRRKSRSERNPSMDLGQVSTEMAVFQAGRSNSSSRQPVRIQATPLRGMSFRP